jgi:hypothetical protein
MAVHAEKVLARLPQIGLGFREIVPAMFTAVFFHNLILPGDRGIPDKEST